MLEGRVENQKSRRGFASMSPERQREIASMGGINAHKLGVAHQWDRQQAMEAGRKGGKRSGEIRKSSREDKNERT